MSKLDILFINPRTELEDKSKIFHREPPNGLLILCARLENAGYNVDLFDLSVNTPSELENCLSEEPSIIGITSLTNTHHLAMEILEKVKKLVPNTITLYGGPHATFKYADILRENKYVDFILCGEADQTILQFMQGISELDYSKVPNLAYRENGKIHFVESYKPMNLDDLPLPARHLLNLEKYEVGTIIVNRGCAFNCAFCVRQKIFKKVRYRKIADIIREMQSLSRLGYRFVNLYDNLNISEDYAVKLCHEIERARINLNWGCELRADRISTELADSLKRAGCKVIAVGVESGDPNVLQRINKMQDLNLVKKGISNAKVAGISVQAYFVIGLPGETEESFNLTRNYLENLHLEPGNDRVNFFAATPYPGTDLYEQPIQFGVRIRHEDWELYDNTHLIMDLDSIEFEKLERNFKIAQEIEEEFISSSDYNK
jgi:anaerobic magnesium-protoporphyrin IX monomethyl ester cyclase